MVTILAFWSVNQSYEEKNLDPLYLGVRCRFKVDLIFVFEIKIAYFDPCNLYIFSYQISQLLVDNALKIRVGIRVA